MNTSAPDVVHWEGWVWKQPSNQLGRYQCRWFEWINDTLYYYKYRDYSVRFPVTSTTPVVSGIRNSNSGSSSSDDNHGNYESVNEQHDDDNEEDDNDDDDLSVYSKPIGQIPLSYIESFEIIRRQPSSTNPQYHKLSLSQYQYGYYQYGIRLHLRNIENIDEDIHRTMNNIDGSEVISSTFPTTTTVTPYLYRSNRSVILVPCNNYTTDYLIQSLWIYGIVYRSSFMHHPGASFFPSSVDSIPPPPISIPNPPPTITLPSSTLKKNTTNDCLYIHLPWLSMILAYTPIIIDTNLQQPSNKPVYITVETIIEDIFQFLQKYTPPSSDVPTNLPSNTTIPLSSRISIIFTDNEPTTLFLHQLILQLDKFRYCLVPLVSSFHTTPLKETDRVFEYTPVVPTTKPGTESIITTLDNESLSFNSLPPLMITKRNTSLPETLSAFDPRSPRMEPVNDNTVGNVDKKYNYSIATENTDSPLLLPPDSFQRSVSDSSNSTVTVSSVTGSLGYEFSETRILLPLHLSVAPCTHHQCRLHREPTASSSSSSSSSLPSTHAHMLLIPQDWLPAVSIDIPRWRKTNDCYGKPVTAYVITTKTGILHWDISHRFYEFRNFAVQLNDYVVRTYRVEGYNPGAFLRLSVGLLANLPIFPSFPRGKPIPHLTKQLLHLSPHRIPFFHHPRHHITVNQPSKSPTTPTKASIRTETVIPNPSFVSEHSPESSSQQKNERSTTDNYDDDHSDDDDNDHDNIRLLDTTRVTPSKLSSAIIDTTKKGRFRLNHQSSPVLPPVPVMSRPDVLRERRRRKLYRWLDQVFSLSLCWNIPLVLEFLGLVDNNSSPTVITPTNATIKNNTSISTTGFGQLWSPKQSQQRKRTDSETKYTAVNPLVATLSYPPLASSKLDASITGIPIEKTLSETRTIAPPLLPSVGTVPILPVSTETVPFSTTPPSIPTENETESDVSIDSTGLPIIPISRVNDVLLPGDILLFSCKNTPSTLQRMATSCRYDHAGIVIDSAWKLRDDNNTSSQRSVSTRKTHPMNLVLLEASGEGVKAYPLVSRLRAYGTGYTHSIVVRRLLLPGEECLDIQHNNNNVLAKKSEVLQQPYHQSWYPRVSSSPSIHNNGPSVPSSFYLYPCGNYCSLYRRRSTTYPPHTYISTTVNTDNNNNTSGQLPWCPCHDLYQSRLRLEKQLGIFLEKVESKARYSLGIQKLLLIPAHLHSNKLSSFFQDRYQSSPPSVTPLSKSNADESSFPSSSTRIDPTSFSPASSWPSLGPISERAGVPLSHYYCTELIACCYMFSGLLPSIDTWGFLAKNSKNSTSKGRSKYIPSITSALDPRAYWPNAWVHSQELRKDKLVKQLQSNTNDQYYTLASVRSDLPLSVTYTLRKDVTEYLHPYRTCLVDHLLTLWVPSLNLDCSKDPNTTVALYTRLDYECVIDCRFKPLQWSKFLEEA